MTDCSLDCSPLPGDPLAFYGAALKKGRDCELLRSCCERHGSMLRDVCLPVTLRLAESDQSFPKVVETGRVLGNILDVLLLNGMSLRREILIRLENYVWDHWNRYTEAVQWNCCNIMAKVVKFYQRCCVKQRPYLNVLLRRIIVTDDCVKAKYKCLKMLLPLLDDCHMADLLNVELPQRCLQAAETSEAVAAQAISFYVAMAKKDKERNFSKSWTATWLEPVLRKATSVSCASDTWCKELLTKLAPVNLEVFLVTTSKYLLDERGSHGVERIVRPYLAAARLGLRIWQNDPRGLEIINLVNKYLFCQNTQIAIEALRLMVDHSKKCLPVEPAHLDQLLKFLLFNAHVQNSSFREEMIVCVKKTFERIRSSAYRLKTHSPDAWPEVFGNYKSFLGRLNAWAVDCLVQNLQFPSRCCALRVMDLMYADETWWCPSYDLSEELEVGQLRRNSWSAVFEALTDCYDRNQIVALKILRRKPPVETSADIDGQLNWARAVLPTSLKLLEISAAVCMIRVGAAVAPMAEDGVRAALRWSISQLISSRRICKESADLLTVMRRTSIFGVVALIRQLLEDVASEETFDVSEFRESLGLITKSCLDIAATFLPALQDGFCDDADLLSPNGGFPQEEIFSSRQSLTLVSWRIIKEINALFSYVVNIVTLNNRGESDEEFAASVIRLICEHFFAVFTRTNHRGVFETAGLFFKEICLSMARSGRAPEIRTRYVNLILENLESNEEVYRLDMRSGGLPFMVSCLLCYDFKGSVELSFLFDDFLNKIVSIATGASTNGIKINCLNILDKLFRNSASASFGKRLSRDTFKLAFTELTSDDWMVRVAAQLFLVAWLRRIFGTPTVSKSKLSKGCRLSDFELEQNCPGIFDILLAALRKHLLYHDFSMDVFVSLAILSRVYPSSLSSAFDARESGSRCRLVSLRPVVSQILLTSPVEHFRSIAARALVSILPPWKLDLVWKALKCHILSRPVKSQNAINGLLHLVAAQDQLSLHSTGEPLLSDDELLQFGRYMLRWAPTNSVFLISLLLSRGCQLPSSYSSFLLLQLTGGGPMALETFRDVAARCAAQSKGNLKLFESCAAEIPSFRLALYKSLAKNVHLRIERFPRELLRLLLDDVLESADEKFLRRAVKAYVRHSERMKSEIGNAQTLRRIRECKDGRVEQLTRSRTVVYFTLFVARCLQTTTWENSLICWTLSSILRVALVRESVTANVCLDVMEILASRSRTELSGHCLSNVIYMIMLQKTDGSIRRRAANLWRLTHPTNEYSAHPEQCLDECFAQIGSSRMQRTIAYHSQLLAIENILQECVADSRSSLEAQSPFVRNNFDCLLEAPSNLRRLLNSAKDGVDDGWQPSPLCSCPKVEADLVGEKIGYLLILCARGSASFAHGRVVRQVKALLERCAEDAHFNFNISNVHAETE